MAEEAAAEKKDDKKAVIHTYPLIRVSESTWLSILTASKCYTRCMNSISSVLLPLASILDICIFLRLDTYSYAVTLIESYECYKPVLVCYQVSTQFLSLKPVCQGPDSRLLIYKYDVVIHLNFLTASRIIFYSTQI